jgi:site-specific DNA recombinase
MTTNIAYVRVSTGTQDVSVERQKEMIIEYCKNNNITTPRILVDEITGFRSDRDGFVEIKRLCQQGRCKTLVIYDLSRLSRSLRDTLEFIEDYVTRYKVRLVCLTQKVDTESPMGKAFLAISAVFNQLYRDEIQFKTNLAMRHLKTKGKYTGGHVPYGYIVDKKNLIPNPYEQDTVTHIRSQVSQGIRIYHIAQQLNEMQIPSKAGKTWTAATIKKILEYPHEETLRAIMEREAVA